MTRTRLILRNLAYHWRGNLAVLLGVFVGSAVLTGALLVGDSLRGSLRARAERQLGWVDAAMIGGRFVRAELAGALPGHVAPAVMLQGTVRSGSGAAPGDTRLLSKVAILGVDERFWRSGIPEGIDASFWSGGAPRAVLSAPLARSLGVGEGAQVRVGVQKIAAIPRASLLGRRGADESAESVAVTVAAVLPPGHPANDFSLTPNPGTPMNLFLPLRFLQEEIEQPGRVNALFAAGATAEQLQASLKEHATLDDWGLKVVVPEKGPGYFSLESRQLLLEPSVVRTARATARQMGMDSAETLVYLANRIVQGKPPLPDPRKNRKNEVPYSIVAALDPSKPPPLGPFLPEGVKELADDEIVLAAWDESPLKGAEPGAPITLVYFEPEIEGRIEETSETFTLRGFVPLKGVAADPELTPEFPGITDKLTIGEWDPPFPFDNSRVLDRDERFWDTYRTTPKAYVTLETGQRLWGTRFGSVTSLRIAPKEGQTPQAAAKTFAEQLRTDLSLEDGGMAFDAVRERLLAASRGSTDFSVLFLGFSFFLIVASLLLVGLLVRLNIDRRAGEIGLLVSTGYPVNTVRRMLLTEGTLVAAAGALLGLAGAALYADLLIRLLAWLWPTGEVGSVLQLHVGTRSLVIGFLATLLMSALTIWLTVRVLRRVSPSDLLEGETTPAPDVARPQRGPRYSVAVVGIGLVGAAVLLVAAPRIENAMARAGTFFGSGALLLTAGLAAVWVWMRAQRHGTIRGNGAGALALLGARNAARNPTRSLLTVGLLASAAFLLVAVESFRRQPGDEFLAKEGGSGGFPLVAEADLPLYQTPDSPEGRAEILAGLQQTFQERGLDARERQRGLEEAEETLDQIRVYPFRLKRGDDASCLNLYQATRPRLLGVPQNLIERGGFSFASTQAETEAQEANPWLLLDERPGDGTIPIFVEQNTANWMLKKGLGGVVEVPDADGETMRLKIVGLLQDSVFQSELLMSERHFKEHFPRLEGFEYFLIDSPPEQAGEVSGLLEAALASHGFDAMPTREKVAAYLEVQNTYLSTFQVLGGFGLLLGVLGLSVVLLRGVWERRGELALLRALGYRSRALNELVLSENVLLLVLGLAVGVVSALIAVAPHLLSGVAVPWGRLALMLAAVLVVGLAVAAVAVVRSVRAPLLEALRRE